MRIQGSWIRDDEGRALLLRGCNLGGSTKVPVSPPAPATAGGSTVSFVGKPFPLEEADERCAELARWGLRFHRLLVPWEAIEHEGPGIYDESYLAYLRGLLLIAEKHGLSVWINPHQDVWGRATGGDGAPAWTLEALGMATERLEAAGAILPRTVTDTVPPRERPRMTWPSGYSRYAAATMFTLFFAGNVYATGVRLDAAVAGDGGETVQDWLQNRYLDAFAHAQRRLKHCAAVAGWGTMNEPHPGFIGYTNLANLENNMVAVGPMPGGFAAMAAASGRRTEVPVYSTGIFGVRRTGTAVLNSEGVSVFKEGFQCPWKTAGVWEDGEDGPRLLRPDHFARYEGRPVRFARDFLAPFMERFIRRLSGADEKALFFVEGVPLGIATGDDAPAAGDGAAAGQGAEQQAAGHDGGEAGGREMRVHAFHWYDGPTMFIKQFRPWFNLNIKTGKIVLGRKAVAALYREQIADHIAPGMPNLVGEFGLPFDLFKGRAFVTGDYSAHEEAFSMYYDALDELLLGACVWDYSADNTFRRGDSWNNEDFSIVTTGDGSGPPRQRAEGGWMRPYPLAVAGTPLLFRWDRKAKRLLCRFRSDPKIAAPTALFIPEGIWDAPPAVTAAPARGEAKEGSVIRPEYRSEERLLLVYHDGFDGEVEVRVERA